MLFFFFVDRSNVDLMMIAYFLRWFSPNSCYILKQVKLIGVVECGLGVRISGDDLRFTEMIFAGFGAF